MTMERLTKRKYGELVSVKQEETGIYCSTFCNTCSQGAGNCSYVKEMVEKLVDYEDAEEQGLLLRLPCKVGDTVWDNDFGRPCGYEVTGFSFGDLNDDYCDDEVTIFDQVVVYYTNWNGSITGNFAMSEIGKTVFLTKPEAEAELQKMKGRKRND